jgi:hypothetical protein
MGANEDTKTCALCGYTTDGKFEEIIVSGAPAQEILKAIEVHAIDLVIMGTHGYKGLQHTIFGSVAENVVKKSPIPVLVVNPYKLGEKHTERILHEVGGHHLGKPDISGCRFSPRSARGGNRRQKHT